MKIICLGEDFLGKISKTPETKIWLLKVPFIFPCNDDIYDCDIRSEKQTSGHTILKIDRWIDKIDKDK